MKKLALSREAKKAVALGTMCSVSYFAVYVVRNMLSAVTPQMLDSGKFTAESIGSISSMYFIVYAIGQLINGALGDRIKAKYMIGFGLILAGVCNAIFTLYPQSYFASLASYAAMGFFLSMIYGPMTRLVAENTDLLYATRCSVGYNFASFFGSPAAGLLATFLAWKSVFNFGSIMLAVMGAVCLIVFSVFEKRGMIKQPVVPKSKQKGGNIRVLFERQIVKFTVISIITGVIRTTVVFWMPTYFQGHLGFPADTAAMLFTIATAVVSVNAFLAVFVYEKLGRNMELTLFLSFLLSAISFILLYFVRYAPLNVALIVLGIMFSNCAASMLWSRYCPSLADTGLVSSATGFLDFVSYIAAAVSSSIFSSAVGTIGWGNLILIWAALMVVGVVICPPKRKQ